MKRVALFSHITAHTLLFLASVDVGYHHNLLEILLFSGEKNMKDHYPVWNYNEEPGLFIKYLPLRRHKLHCSLPSLAYIELYYRKFEEHLYWCVN